MRRFYAQMQSLYVHLSPYPPPIAHPNPSLLRMPRRPLTRIIHTHKRPIHLLQPLQTILQRLRDIMAPIQPAPTLQHNIQLHPHAITRVVRGDRFVRVDDGSEAPGEVGDFLQEGGRDSAAGEADDVGEHCGCPVVDYEEGEEGGAEGVEPPEGEVVADEGEEEGEGIEVDVRFAV